MKRHSRRETRHEPRYQESTRLKFVDIKLWEELKKAPFWAMYYEAYYEEYYERLSSAVTTGYTMQPEDAPPPYSYMCPTPSEASTCNINPLKES
jgi:hypothetical protein